MASSRRREKLLREVGAQIKGRLEQPISDLKSAHEILAYLAWLLLHCRRFANVPSFLDAARSDIVAILYAGVVGLERTAYLHSRSLLENLLRHCYYDSRPSLFVAKQVEDGGAVRDRWAHLFESSQKLPCFHAAVSAPGAKTSPPVQQTPAADDAADADPGSSVFEEIAAVYAESCRFVHGPTLQDRSLLNSIRTIDLDPKQTKALGEFLQRLGECSILLITLYHLGPYLLISQPVRRYMLLAMRDDARDRVLRALENVPLAWALHHRSAALATLRDRRRNRVQRRDGIEIDAKGNVRIVLPNP